MDVKILPSTLNGEISIPSSKSITHRAIIAASLCKGKSILHHLTLSDDILATLNAIKHYGADYKIINGEYVIFGTEKIIFDHNDIDCNESGSTLRFLIPIMLLQNQKVTYVGEGRLMSRPLDIYKNIVKQNSGKFNLRDNKLSIKGTLKSQNYIIPGNVSSQFITGLLFALPLLNSDSRIEITDSLESKDYIKLTIDILRKFNIFITWKKKNVLFIKGNQEYKNHNINIEGDYSQAAFFLAYSYLKHPLKLNNIKITSLQGDSRIVKLLLSAEKNRKLHVSLKNIPDLGPILMTIASFLDGTSTFTHFERLKLKESDRVLAMEQELTRAGIDFKTTKEKIIIKGTNSIVEGQRYDSHNDHRIAMALTILLLLFNVEGTILGAECVKKSYPDFFKDIKSLGGNIHVTSR